MKINTRARFWTYLCLVVISLMNGATSCDWFTYDGGHVYYCIGAVRLSHTDALGECNALGGNLVRLPNRDIAEALGSQLSSDSSYLIDLEDTVQEGTFRYNDGSEPCWTEWANGEPNDKSLGGAPTSADCVVYTSGAGMMDRNCLDTYVFICYKVVTETTDVASTPAQSPSTLPPVDSGDGMATSDSATATGTTLEPETTTATWTSSEPAADTVTSQTNLETTVTQLYESVLNHTVNISLEDSPLLQWNEWTMWTMCSVSCDSGSRFRLKLCSNPEQNDSCTHTIVTRKGDVLGYGVQIVVCNDFPCPQDGVWLPWSPWSACSATCGRGFSQRSRRCMEPRNGGKECGSETTEHRICEEEDCPAELHRIEKVQLSPPYTESDHRASAVGIGITGAIILALIGVILICMDVHVLCKHCRSGFGVRTRQGASNARLKQELGSSN